MCVTTGIFAQSNTNALIGYWEVQNITVGGVEDKGEAGAYWIFRKDGSFKIIKRGRKPDGKWATELENKLSLEIHGQPKLEGTWEIDKETLTFKADQGGNILIFTFIKRYLKEEPSEPNTK